MTPHGPPLEAAPSGCICFERVRGSSGVPHAGGRAGSTPARRQAVSPGAPSPWLGLPRPPDRLRAFERAPRGGRDGAGGVRQIDPPGRVGPLGGTSGRVGVARTIRRRSRSAAHPPGVGLCGHRAGHGPPRGRRPRARRLRAGSRGAPAGIRIQGRPYALRPHARRPPRDPLARVPRRAQRGARRHPAGIPGGGGEPGRATAPAPPPRLGRHARDHRGRPRDRCRRRQPRSSPRRRFRSAPTTPPRSSSAPRDGPSACSSPLPSHATAATTRWRCPATTATWPTTSTGSRSPSSPSTSSDSCAERPCSTRSPRPSAMPCSTASTRRRCCASSRHPTSSSSRSIGVASGSAITPCSASSCSASSDASSPTRSSTCTSLPPPGSRSTAPPQWRSSTCSTTRPSGCARRTSWHPWPLRPTSPAS